MDGNLFWRIKKLMRGGGLCVSEGGGLCVCPRGGGLCVSEKMGKDYSKTDNRFQKPLKSSCELFVSILNTRQYPYE